MLHKTRGIVFRFTKYGETSIIVTIFTEAFGLQSYIVNGIRSKSAKNRIALFQPLTLLNLVVYHRPNANLERIKEVSCFHPYQQLMTDVRKSTMAIFLTELLNKTVKEDSHSAAMFDFIASTLVTIDLQKEGFENAHLIFMVKLSRVLGFGPQFVNEILGARMTEVETEQVIQRLISAEYNQTLVMSNAQRRAILDLLLKFYQEHIENLNDLKSVPVLKEVLG